MTARAFGRVYGMAQAKMTLILSKPWLGSPNKLQSPVPKSSRPWVHTPRRRMAVSAATQNANMGGGFQASYAKAFPGLNKERKVRPPGYDMRTDEPWKKYLDTKLSNNMTIAEFIARFATGKSGLRTYKAQKAKLALPETKGRPLLIWHALEHVKPEVQRVEQLLEQSEDNLVYVLGGMGCGKSRLAYELLTKDFGFYFTGETDVNRGSGDMVYVQRMMPVLLEDMFDVPKRDANAEQHARALILGRMLVLDHLFRLRIPNFNPAIFLQLQIEGPKMTNTDIFRELTAVLCTEYSNQDISKQIDVVWGNLQHAVRKLRIVVEEAQVLYHCRPNVFPLRKSHLEPLYIYNPFVKAMLFPSQLRGHDLVICGTGLELLSEGNQIGPIKTKPVLKFTDFPLWEDEVQIMRYLENFAHVTIDDCRALLHHFGGRLKPLVSCVEGYVGGLDPNGKPVTYKNIQQCIGDYEKHAVETIDKRHTLAYFLKELKVIDKPTYDLVRNTYRAFAWWGDSFEAVTMKELKMVYLGFARFKAVPIDEPSAAEVLTDKVTMLTGVMDEPLPAKTLHKHFSADKELLEDLRVSSLVPGKGRLWEQHLFDDLVRLFNGSTPLNEHPLLKDVEVPEIFRQPGSIVNADKQGGPPLVVPGHINYGLLEFMRQPEEGRPAMLICENMAGPDAFFFVKLQDGKTIGVFVHAKYKHRSSSYGAAMHYTEPEAAYIRWKNEPPRKDAHIQAAKRQAYEQYMSANATNLPWTAGFVRLMLTWPAAESSGQKTRVINPQRGGPQLVIEINDVESAQLFSEEHKKALELMRPIRLLDVRPEPVRDFP